MARRARVSPDRILTAAAAEFAARGYAGARVDRIARRARVNKAMLYYHFRSKRGLYRALLRRAFAAAAARLRAVAAADLAPADKLDRAIAGLAAFVDEHAFFPAVMLREIAEGGVHLDPGTLAAMAAVPREVAGIIQQGVDQRAFRPVHPMAAYVSLIAPVVFFLAGAPIRRELAAQELADFTTLSPARFLAHVQETTRRALALDAAAPAGSAPVRERSSP
jgi:TetR/AcrR family transcriptional regulator